MTQGDLGLDGAVCGFLLDDVWFPLLVVGSFFFFSFPFFFFSATWLLVSLLSPSEKEEGEGETNEEEDKGSTLGSTGG